MSTPIYNAIGAGYNATRRADPYIASRVLALLNPESEGKYLDIGCGTGNYLHYFRQEDYDFYGIDPSETMLEKARQKCPADRLMNGYAENLPYENDFFNGATAMFTLHHWSDKQQGINELYRVMKPGGRVVFLSFTAWQMEGYWLNHYFPETMRNSAVIPDEQEKTAMLHHAGFGNVQTEKYFVHADLQDHFLYSGKFDPERYLNPAVRNGISSFSAFSNRAEVEAGLVLLERDIRSGEIREIMQQYDNDRGDYLFYFAEKTEE